MSTHITEKQQSNGLLFGRKTVVGTFARHVREIYAFAKLKQSEIYFLSFYLNDIFNAVLTHELSDTVNIGCSMHAVRQKAPSPIHLSFVMSKISVCLFLSRLCTADINQINTVDNYTMHTNEKCSLTHLLEKLDLK